MKKLIKLLLLCVFLISATDLFAQTVYVNKADSKFHLLTCKYLDPSHDSLSMAFAIRKGLGECPVCNPTGKSASASGSMGSMGAPKSMDTPKNMEKSGMEKQGNSAGSVTGQQCAVINKDGKRCIGKAETGTIYCWEHKDYKK